ncbi:MAG: DUF3108 domain-containing protein [Herminiimonas sp.]|nr:DUF3108 domain-containing protein [Herminiimonas sp.]
MPMLQRIGACLAEASHYCTVTATLAGMRALDTADMPARPPAPPAGTRWWLLLALSLLLHLMLLAAAGGGIGMPAAVSRAPAAAVVSAGVVSGPAPSTAVALPPPALPRGQSTAPVAPLAAAAPRQRQAPARPQPAASVSQDEVPAIGETLPTPADGVASGAPEKLPAAPVQANAASPTDVVPGPVGTASDATANASARPRYTIDLPPSATLSYEVRYATRGSITRGSSAVAWRSDGNTYTVRGEVSKFGFTLSAFRSEGAIDDAGIAPLLYAEKNARRAETNTHFLRDARQAISFSAATDSAPLQPGAQDRASIPWQLAGIARGQPELLVPGTMLDVLVAGVRDAEHWMIEVIGEETVNLDTGPVQAWHLVRAPRIGTYDKRIDIWLAPAQQWYPVKLRYTEQSGDYLDLSLSALQ